MLKVLFRDPHGYCLLAKRLDAGTFKIAVNTGSGKSSIEITQRDFAALMTDLTISF